MSGATYYDMKKYVAPILNTLKQYFQIEVLLICGNNELMGNIPYQKIIDRIQNFFVVINRPNLDENGDEIAESGMFPLRFMQLPYLPCISRFESEDHPLKITVKNISINRVKDITNLNRFFKQHNARVEPKTSKDVPSMKYAGITSKTFDRTPPRDTKHLYSHWVGASKHSANKMVHVLPKRRLPFWRKVHEFFNPKEE